MKNSAVDLILNTPNGKGARTDEGRRRCADANFRVVVRGNLLQLKSRAGVDFVEQRLPEAGRSSPDRHASMDLRALSGEL